MITEAEKATWKRRIDLMDQEEMCRMMRFSPVGHPVFDSSNDLYEYFMARFDSLGGMTPEISKKIGWK